MCVKTTQMGSSVFCCDSLNSPSPRPAGVGAIPARDHLQLHLAHICRALCLPDTGDWQGAHCCFNTHSVSHRRGQ